MFTDRVLLKLLAGSGGNGVVAWRREKYIPKGGPAGGNGGYGGSILIKADTQLNSLQEYRNQRILRAERGGDGGSNNKQGKRGKSLTLKVPCGTLIKNKESGEVLYDLSEDGQLITICEGGRGGKGNTCFKSPTNRAPNICTPGKEGQELEVELELKLIADVGFVGMPNAGKSTLMKAMTAVPVKIAPYPFTTLIPNLGYVQREDYSRVLIADIPGIIKDAHSDRGLGFQFLKHIERTQVLVFVIDLSGIDQRDPLSDFEVLLNELKTYDPKLLEKPSLVALNKIDTPEAEEHLARFKEKYNLPLFPISALTGDGISRFIETMCDLSQTESKHY